MGSRIVEVDAWEVLDSRGQPTVATEIRLSDGSSATASVPSGASVGTYEAHELRDGGERYAGKGVLNAVANARGACRDAVVGLDATDQRAVDAALRDADGTPGLSILGANTVLGVSVATASAAAVSAGVPLYRWVNRDLDVAPTLPLPMVNIVSGGAHAGGAVDIQDVLVVPLSAGSFAEAIEVAAQVRRCTAEVAADDGLGVALVADEGGLGPPLPSNRAALELVCRGIERAGLLPGVDAALAIDVAATQFWRDGRYVLAAEGRTVSGAEWIAEVAGWVRELPIVSVEDPCADEDWAGWEEITRVLPDGQLLGDDLFVTAASRLERGITESVGNAILVKPNQNGTLTGAAEVTARARAASYAAVVSARSGETEDAWMADLAVGWAAGQVKVGSTTRSERTAKWNRLLRIERELGSAAAYAGSAALAGRS